MNSKTHLENS